VFPAAVRKHSLNLKCRWAADYWQARAGDKMIEGYVQNSATVRIKNIRAVLD
jgi:hypothetical protein